MNELSEEELRLLLTYRDGPRIWDAAVLAPTVYRLLDLGLIEDAGPQSPNACRLTTKGRFVLD